MIEGDKIISWKSNHPEIVSVNAKGKMTAKKKGKAIVTVTLASGKTAKCTVTVQSKKVKTTGLKLSNKKISLQKGRKMKLQLQITPVTTQEKITYKVLDKKIATVSKVGILKGNKKGSTKIIAKSGNKKVTATIVVK